MSGELITIEAADGAGAFRAYLAVPRAGRGPGIVLLHSAFGLDRHMRDLAGLYAEEGYVVVCPDLYWRIEPGLDLGQNEADRKRMLALYQKFDSTAALADIDRTISALRGRGECAGKIGVVGFCLGGGLAYHAAAQSGVDCAVAYYGVGIDAALDLAPRIVCPLLLHFAENDNYVPASSVVRIREALASRPDIRIHTYPGTGHGFNRLDGGDYHKSAANLAHSRSIALLRRAMGPDFDLEALWEAHTTYEFATRDVEATMRTMVADPYVNHVPVITGGVGARDLARFYANHFIPTCPKDINMVPISRTVGADRVVDEMVLSFTHDVEIDWMLPGVPPTGRRVEIPLVAIVGFRGDKLYHEHIYWDQASVLVQIGLLDPTGLPVAGVETAEKLRDETRPSNTLMRRWAESAP
ncbi:MAG TPA: dienelactone hydrolase family protein [Stellaceae bacterium]|nr:dienelactone hydrolase family protein [Stellaceae bacterium]